MEISKKFYEKCFQKGGNTNKFFFLPHQKHVIEYFYNSNNRGIILFHGTGSGKTITSIGICERFPYNDVIVLGPASLKENYEKNFDKMNLNPISRKRFEIESYNSFINKIKNEEIEIEDYFKNKIVIIDEAHNLRNNNQTSNLINKTINPTNKYEGNLSECRKKLGQFEVMCYPNKLINSSLISKNGVDEELLIYNKNTKKRSIFEIKNSNSKTGNRKSIKKNLDYDKLDKECKGVISGNRHEEGLVDLCSLVKKDAFKVILLTGTPMMNHPADLSRLINIIEGEKELNEDTSVFSQMFISEKEREVYNKKLKLMKLK